ncbi:MAG: cyclophilin-like fold protein [Nitrospiraceae bacterium]
MENGTRRIKISVGSVSLEAELKTSKTADAIYAALPVETSFNTWGEEFYLKIPGVKDHRETATTQVKVGDLAFWGAGEVLAIFFGQTPMSVGPDPVPADRVNIVGRILGDPTLLRGAMDASRIKIEKV